MENPDPVFVADQLQHYHEDKRAGLIVSNSVLLVVAYFAVALKFLARRLAHTTFKTDDYWNWFSLVLFTGYSCSCFLTVHYGSGLHIIRVINLKGYVIATIIATSLYNCSILAIKLSFLYFYKRLFPQRWFKFALVAVGAFIVSSSIAFFFLDILNCIPPASQWDKRIKGKCVNFTAVVLAAGIVNVITDFMILILPMPVLWNLKMSSARKRMTIGTFMLGGLVCAVSTVRCCFLASRSGLDVSWDRVKTVELSTIELGIGILSSCLPAYKPLYNHVFFGQATANVEDSRDKKYNTGSGNSHQGIHMASLVGHAKRQRLGSQDDDEGKLFGGTTLTSIRAEEGLHTFKPGINITTGFGSSSTEMPKVSM